MLDIVFIVLENINNVEEWLGVVDEGNVGVLMVVVLDLLGVVWEVKLGIEVGKLFRVFVKICGLRLGVCLLVIKNFIESIYFGILWVNVRILIIMLCWSWNVDVLILIGVGDFIMIIILWFIELGEGRCRWCFY